MEKITNHNARFYKLTLLTCLIMIFFNSAIFFIFLEYFEIESNSIYAVWSQITLFYCVVAVSISVGKYFSNTHPNLSNTAPFSSINYFLSQRLLLQVIWLILIAVLVIAVILTGLDAKQVFSEGTAIQGLVFSLCTAYLIFFSQASKTKKYDLVLFILIGIFCIITGRRTFFLIFLLFYVIIHTRFFSVKKIVLYLFGAFLFFIVLSLFRENLSLEQTVLRLMGNYLRIIFFYDLGFSNINECFGISSLFPFFDKIGYSFFYEYIAEPLPLLNQQLWWDSSSLLERLVLSTCSYNYAILLTALFFFAIGLTFDTYDSKLLRLALLVIIVSIEGFPFYDIISFTLIICLIIFVIISRFLIMFKFKYLAN